MAPPAAAVPAAVLPAATARADGRGTRATGAKRRRRAATTWPWLAGLLLCSCDPVVAQTPSAPVTCEREVAAAAQRYGIPLAVFYAVGLNETGARGRLQPFAMNIDGRASLHATQAEAVADFHKAKAAGARMIDVGCMQINHHYHAQKFASLEAMFDPRFNVDYAARFLRELKDREKTWTMAVARYNAGPNNDPAQKTYVCGVLGRMVASGFGAWTESAKKFCFSPPVAKAPVTPVGAGEGARKSPPAA